MVPTTGGSGAPQIPERDGRRSARFLRLIPKLELHVHLEGTVRPALLAEIHRRNGGRGGEDSDRAAIYRETADLAGFLGRFKALTGFLRRPEDFYDAARHYAGELAGFRVLYSEMHFSPQIFVRREIPFAPMMAAIHAGLQEVSAEGGIRIRLILDGVRQWGPEAMRELLDLAEGSERWGVVGIGMGGDETSYPCEAFRQPFREARRRGWRTTVHAGEAAGADSVRSALEILQVDRIGHGVAARRDADLLNRLADRGVTLDLCPTSQLRTGAVSPGEPYPARMFLDRGIPVTISSDDPALFGTDLISELQWLVETAGFRRQDLLAVQRHALDGCFLPRPEREELERAFQRGILETQGVGPSAS